MEKMTYVAPTLEEIGSFEEITRSVNGTAKLDATFPANTPFGQLTFS